ncbi:membrane protein [Desulfonema ishimotonii]|uniref:Membrane protein n=1 Tax=Desulfonema ishimotonii TaxID=45657 RepID=A0A401FVR0_9BACT|nr:DUF364 domain-containing protein [Desulfonema ishimotonii]GBC61024.1 membrane protein [Desulfonema ishimotonii]
MTTDIYEILKQRALNLFNDRQLLDKPVQIHARALSTEEAIGNPEADDFPLQKGNERLMQATFEEACGQAFTDLYGDFEGTLAEVMEMRLHNNYRRAIFTATLNAVLSHMGLIRNTIHCKDKGPSVCAEKLADYIGTQCGKVRITQIGFQPKMVEHLAARYPFRIIDLDEDNIGKEKYGAMVEGPEATDDAIDWAELLLVTGTTLANGTITSFLNKKPVLFYGTTIAGAAYLMNWDRFCDQSI